MTLICTILQVGTSLGLIKLGPTGLLTQIANPAVRTVAFAGAASVGLLVFRVKATSARLFTWTAVLYAALAMPLLGWMLPPLAVPTPAFLHHEDVQPAYREVQVPEPVAATTPAATKRSSTVHNEASEIQNSAASMRRQAQPHATQAATAAPAPSQRSIRWSEVAIGIYVFGTLILLVRLMVGLVLGRRLLRASQEIQEPRVSLRLAFRSRACGLAVIPPIAESEFTSVPVTIGALRSTILLPVIWREWENAKLDAVIAHEVSHVARRDALTQRLSLLHRAIFWFSPLAWWLDRHLTDLAEQASDEAALSSGAERNHYARTLLGFFEAMQAAPGRVWWQGVSMGKAGQAEQRLERILAWRGAVTMRVKKSIAVVMIALALPVIYLAASVRPGDHNQDTRDVKRGQDQTAPAIADDRLDAPPAPALAPVAPSGPPVPMTAGVANPGPAAAQPTAPTVPTGPEQPPSQSDWTDQSVSSSSSSGPGYSYGYGYDDDERFVIVTGKSDSLTMSGSMQDARHVEKLRKQISGDFIWFQRDEKSFIIRDQPTIDRARKFWAPQEELGKKQAELGKQQEALGKQQQALGEKMEQVHVNVPDMTAELDKLKTELKQLSSGATMSQVGKIQSEIGELQSRIGEIQSQAGVQQSDLGRQQGELGQKQGKLGAQQGELGRRQGELARQASRQMKELLDEAIAKGTAQPEPSLL